MYTHLGGEIRVEKAVTYLSLFYLTYRQTVWFAYYTKTGIYL